MFLTGWSRLRARDEVLWQPRTLRLEILSSRKRLFATEAFYEAAFSSLGPELQSKLMNLFPVDDANLNNLDKNQILLRKFNANCFETEDKAAPVQEAAVFEMLSMINHSCESNVMWFADEVDKTRIEVRVCRRIKKGDEIVLSYIISLARVGSCFPLRQQRMDKLKLRGFECRSC